MRNKFIVFEGIDGSGKTSISKCLVRELIKRGIYAIRYEDVEYKYSGFNSIKEFVINNCSPHASFMFYIASAIHKSDVIRKLLQDSWVVCDRYVYSTIAHHIAKGVSKEFADCVFENSTIIKPDYFLLMTVDESVRLRRVAERSNSTKDDFIEKKYGTQPFVKEQILKGYNPIIIDNSDEGIHKKVNEICSLLLKP